MQEVHRKFMNFFMEMVRKKYKICKNIPGFFYILPKDSRFFVIEVVYSDVI